MLSFLKKNWFSIISISLSFFVLVYFVFFQSGIDSLLLNAKNIQVKYMFFSIVFLIIYWLLDALCLYILTKANFKNQKFLASLKTAIIGLLYSAITPFAVGGQPMQIIEMSKENIPPGDAGSIITIKSIAYQGALTIYALIAVFITGNLFKERVQYFNIFIFLGFLANIIFIGFIILIALNKSLTLKISTFIINFLAKIKIVRKPEKRLKSTITQIENFHSSISMFSNDIFLQLKLISITILQLTIFYSITFFIYKGFSLEGASVLYIISAQSIVMMITAFIPLPGGSGAAEGSFYLFFALFFTKESILPAVFIWRFITYYLCIIVGGILSFYDMFRAKLLRS